MKFSVLIPVYNVEQYLEKCINSIVDQNYSDYEIIIVDDGSTDNSGRICDSFKDKYPEIITVIHKQNQGLISARRVAIQKAKGDYCIFVDSDDYVASNLFDALSFYLSRNAVDIVIYLYTYFSNNTIGETKRSFATNNNIWCDERKKELYTLLATTSIIDAMFIKAIKRELLQNDPTDYSIYYHKNMSEDTLQSIYPLSAAENVGYLDESLYYYRYNPKSISRNYSVDTIENKNSNHVYKMILEYLPKWGLDNKDFIQRVNARWFNEAMYYFCKTYENAKDYKQREQVLKYDWNSLIPCTEVDSYSEYVNQNYLRIYKWVLNHKWYRIYDYFNRQKIYKKIKSSLHTK